ncbi:CRISPR-associated RAMP protein, family [Candidatus Magnetomorum sp. HK-1]|nr:CRISPR-associated RAMP protein, family [Candidatus Magnetomorum sp. HK-1]
MNYRITAELLSPLMIAQNRQSDASESLSYMPGSSLRGAIAAKYLREFGHQDSADFQRIFVDHPISFPNLLPTIEKDLFIPKPLPLTAASCKRFSGFHYSEKASHGVLDTLAEKVLEKYNPEHLCSAVCPSCQNDMKSFTGFWNGIIESPTLYKPTMIYQRHTGIDRTSGTIAQKIFYITQAIADYNALENDQYLRQYLAGPIHLTDEECDILRPLLNSSLFAGSDRTRGMGEFKLTLTDDEPQPTDVCKWDISFKDRLNKIDPKSLDSLLNGFYFTINLYSDAILLDCFLRPTAQLDLSFETIPAGQIKPVLKVARSKTIRGWNLAWGLPKTDDMAVSMGSVYLFKYDGNDVQQLNQELDQLMCKGIGVRKAEGFGRISICDNFHLIKEVI